MKIYTKTGDKGTTSLHNGSRVLKSHIRVDTYGTIDELNSIIGIITTLSIENFMKEHLERINHLLFSLGADLSTPFSPPPKFEVTRICSENITWLESLIDQYQEQLPPIKYFILPGGTTLSAYLQNARTVCRRAERLLVALSQEENVGEFVLMFVNRLSDYLFVASRMANFLSEVPDVKWEKTT